MGAVGINALFQQPAVHKAKIPESLGYQLILLASEPLLGHDLPPLMVSGACARLHRFPAPEAAALELGRGRIPWNRI
jgi:hypothetical protein